MRKKFLTVYDYGTGGVWRYIYANSAKDILDKYPGLTILDCEPDWFKDRPMGKITTIDFEDPPDIFLRTMRKPLPKIHIEVDVDTDETDEFRRLITEFGDSQGFAIENFRTRVTNVHGRSWESFTLYLARTDMDVLVEDRDEPNRMKFEMCNANESPEFEAVVAKCRELLESRWPGRMRPQSGE